MLKLILRRTPSTEEGTVGYLYNGRIPVCYTLELPWLDNDPAGDGDDIVSCIPPGTYQVDYMAKSASGKYRDVYHVKGVPGRSEILIHPANFAGDKRNGYRSDLLGCIAPGRRMGRLQAQMAAIDSRLALNDLHEVTGRRPFELTILDITKGWN